MNFWNKSQLQTIKLNNNIIIIDISAPSNITTLKPGEAGEIHRNTVIMEHYIHFPQSKID